MIIASMLPDSISAFLKSDVIRYSFFFYLDTNVSIPFNHIDFVISNVALPPQFAITPRPPPFPFVDQPRNLRAKSGIFGRRA